MIRKLFICVLFIISLYAQGQNSIDANTKISLITVGSGSNLYDTFGHTAIRIKTKNFDRVYNYGFYNFNTPNFYTKFARGKLLYTLESYPFHYFLRDYIQENRTVQEQILNLNTKQKEKIFLFIENNALPKNKAYLYNFFFDNCATRPRDIIESAFKNSLEYKNSKLDYNYTFRELIYQKLNNHPWSKFGIDLALGSIIDRKASVREASFLPEYLHHQIKNASFNNNKLVTKENILFKSSPKKIESINYFTPFLLFSLLVLFILFISFRDIKQNKITKSIDFVLLLISGLIGLIIIFLWFFTDHKATANNFNVFWAFFPNLFFAFYYLKSKNNLLCSKYFLFLIVLIIITIIFWMFRIQIYNFALIPILIILIVRYLTNYLLLVKKS